MFFFYSYNDVLVDGSIDISWVTNNNVHHKVPVRQCLYTEWNPDVVKKACEHWRDIIIKQSSHYSSLSIVGNSDTIFNLLDSFKSIKYIGIQIIQGTNNV